MARSRMDMLGDWIETVGDMLEELETYPGPTEFGDADYERLWDGMMNLMAILQDVESH